MIEYSRKIAIAIAVLLTLLSLQACSRNTHHADIETENERVICLEPRPEVCTMDYQPVCALLKNGSYKNYSNGCSACSDLAVVSYLDEPCK